jgi:hypothetical protein
MERVAAFMFFAEAVVCNSLCLLRRWMTLGRICVLISLAFIRRALFLIGIWGARKFNDKHVKLQGS